MKKVIIVAGARPNFMKIAPLMKEFNKHRNSFKVNLVHTGQHYDYKMSEVFFQNLNIPKPDIYLNVGSGSHAVQTSTIMTAFEKVVLREKPDLVIVVGDVNSTVACSLVASKMNVKVAHVEAGLRSFDRTMPEEINRIVTDSLSDFLFVSEKSGLKNLNTEGVHAEKVHFVGNIMIDTLLANRTVINKSGIVNKLNLMKKKYCVMTLHRPSNVDSKESLSEIIDILETIAQKVQIIYPVHPRTLKMIKLHGFLKKFQGLNRFIMIDPLGYVDFIKLVKDSLFVLTDSGGIQEETTVLHIPCLTMRENTERPVTVSKGSNYLVGREHKKIMRHVHNILNGDSKKGSIPELWDGKTAKRIVTILSNK
ncbi:MAG: UDP-N-acetylglucosamine 2-epimerase (non-hydrolyzing) [Nitrospiraceae bacterium]|nr:MAG: UDP-N-acetylglucosamine 2-epimerase (non-hydrolyzing) [Nitrospiraceae bacterium]